MFSEQQFLVLELFVGKMYGPTSPRQDVNRVRQSMFSQLTRSLGNLPPTHAALGPVSGKPRKFCGPVKPTFTYTSPFLHTDERKMALRARKATGAIEKRAPVEQHAKRVAFQAGHV